MLQSDAQPLDLCDDRNYGSIAGVVSYYFVCDRCALSSTTQDFPYDITSFSFSFLAGSPMLFTYAGLIVAAVLYEDEHKNGNIKMQWRLGFPEKSCF